MADGKVVINVNLKDNDFKKGMKNVRDEVANLDNDLKKHDKSAKGLFSGLGEAAGVAGKAVGKVAVESTKAFASLTKEGGKHLSGFVVDSVKVGMEFDSTMSKVQAISGATGEDLSRLRAKAEEMGKTTVFSAKDSADALVYMGMAGWEADQMLEGLPGVMHLAAASGEELALVSDIVTDALTGFRMEAKDASNFADLLASTATSSNTNVGLMGETFKYVAPVAGSLGVSAEDAALAIGILANAGIKGSMAGTTLKNTLSRMISPNKKTAASMKELGISVTDSAGNMKPFSQVIDETREAFSGLTTEEKAFHAEQIAGKQALAGFLAIVDAAPEDIEKMKKATTDYTGAAQDMSDIMNDNLKGDVAMLKSATEGLQISLSNMTQGGLRQATQGFTKFVEAIDRGVNDGFKDIDKTVEKFVGDFIGSIDSKESSFLDAGLKVISGVFSGISNNTDKLGEIVGTIATKLITFFLENFPKFIKSGFEIIRGIGEGIIENREEIVKGITTAIETLLTTIVTNLPAILAMGVTILLMIVEGIYNAIENLVLAAWDIVKEFLSPLIEAIEDIKETVKNWIEGMLDTIKENYEKLKESAIEFISNFIDGIVETYEDIKESIVTLITNIFTAITEKYQEMKEKAVEFIGNFIQGIRDKYEEVTQSIKDTITGIFTAITEKYQEMKTKAVEFLDNFISGIREKYEDTKQAIKDNITGIFTSISEKYQEMKEKGREIISNFISGIRAKRADTIESISNLGEKIKEKLGNIKLFSIGKNIIGGLIDGFENMKNAVTKKINDVVMAPINGVKKLLGIKSPSRYMKREIGRWIPEGLALGVEDNIDVVDKASIEMTERVIPQIDTITPFNSKSLPGGAIEPINTTHNITNVTNNTKDTIGSTDTIETIIELLAIIAGNTGAFTDKRDLARKLAPYINREFGRLGGVN